MKRMAGFVLFVFLAGVPAAAGQEDVTFVARGSYFRPSDTMYSQIYGGGVAFSLEIAVPIWKSLDVWAEGGYFSKTGALTLTGEPTRLWSLPGGAGLRFVLAVGPLRLYAGAGGGYFKFVEDNRIGTVVAGRLGVIAKAGVFLPTRSGLVLDASVRYTACRMKPVDLEFGVGGFEAGLGIGYRSPVSSLHRVAGGKVRRDFSLSAGVLVGHSEHSWESNAMLWLGAALDLRLAKSLIISPEIVSVPSGFVTVSPGVLVNYEIGPGFVGGGVSVPIVMSGPGNPGFEGVTPKLNFGIWFKHFRLTASFTLREGNVAPALGIGYQGVNRTALPPPAVAAKRPSGKSGIDFSINAGVLADLGEDGGAVATLGAQIDIPFGRTVMLSPELNLLTNFGGALVLPGALLNFKVHNVFTGLGAVYVPGDEFEDEGGLVLPKINVGYRGRRITGTVYLITTFESLFSYNLFGASIGYRF
jgi:hypothetical protein